MAKTLSSGAEGRDSSLRSEIGDFLDRMLLARNASKNIESPGAGWRQNLLHGVVRILEMTLSRSIQMKAGIAQASSEKPEAARSVFHVCWARGDERSFAIRGWLK
jgi:hypothetical protein